MYTAGTSSTTACHTSTRPLSYSCWCYSVSDDEKTMLRRQDDTATHACTSLSARATSRHRPGDSGQTAASAGALHEPLWLLHLLLDIRRSRRADVTRSVTHCTPHSLRLARRWDWDVGLRLLRWPATGADSAPATQHTPSHVIEVRNSAIFHHRTTCSF